MFENRGKSLLLFPTDYTIIDIETTGFSTMYDEIIEIGALKIRDGNVIDTFTTLVKPVSEVNSFTTELTGINNDMLKNAPKFKDIASALLSFIGNDIVVGHNVSFDVNFIYSNLMNDFSEYFSNDFVDTLRICRNIVKGLPNYKLATLIDYFKLKKSGSHRSLPDCYSTLYLLQYLYTYKEENKLELTKYKKPYKKGNFTTINFTFNVDDFEKDENSYLFDRHVCFTGVLEKMVRNNAKMIVERLGGICDDTVTSRTNFLVLGNNDYCSSIKDGKSNKHKKAEALLLKGNDIQVIPEDTFYELLNI